MSSLAGSTEGNPSRPGRVLYPTPPALQTHLARVVLEILISRKQVSAGWVLVGVGLPAGSQAVPPDGLDVSEQVSARIFAQKTENRSPPGEREMQGSSVGLSWVLRAQKP